MLKKKPTEQTLAQKVSENKAEETEIQNWPSNSKNQRQNLIMRMWSVEGDYEAVTFNKDEELDEHEDR